MGKREGLERNKARLDRLAVDNITEQDPGSHGCMHVQMHDTCTHAITGSRQKAYSLDDKRGEFGFVLAGGGICMLVKWEHRGQKNLADALAAIRCGVELLQAKAHSEVWHSFMDYLFGSRG